MASEWNGILRQEVFNDVRKSLENFASGTANMSEYTNVADYYSFI